MKKASTKKKTATKSALPAADSASRRIDARIAELGDWRGETLAKLRNAIRRADTAIVEEWKWDVPVWSCGGIVCTGETYEKAVKLTFAKGALLDDPTGLFNASLAGATRRAIDVGEGVGIDAKALQVLVREAIALNATQTTARAAKKKR